MKYKVTLDDRGYIQSFTHTGTKKDTVEIDIEETRKHPLFCFYVEDKKAVYDPLKYEEFIREQENTPTWQETIEAQIFYTAMSTNTLLED